MTPRDKRTSALVADWLKKAEADLALAQHLLGEGSPFLNAIAFHCQQAAEKYLKAFLVSRQIPFPKSHDLAELLDLAATADAELAESMRAVIVLTPYGVELRYPGDIPDATPQVAQDAVDLAKAVRDAVLSRLPRNR